MILTLFRFIFASCWPTLSVDEKITPGRRIHPWQQPVSRGHSAMQHGLPTVAKQFPLS